jgi:O-antigen ligase
VIFWPGNLDRWVLAKLIVLGVGAVLALWVTPRGRLPRLLVLAGLGGILVLLVSALVSPHPLTSLTGRWPRYEGAVSLAGYGLALWLGARLLGPGASTRERDVTRCALAIAAGVLAIVGVLQAVHAPIMSSLLSSNLSRPGSLLGNATDQGAVGAAVALVLTASILRRRVTWLPVIGVIFGVTNVLLSGSRSALIVLAVGIVATVVIDGVKSGWRRGVVAVSIGALVAVAILALTVPTISSRVLGTSPLAGSSAADRAIIWGDTLAVVAQHPLLGVGPNRFEDAVAATHGVAWFRAVGQSTTLESPHDFVLQALVVGGPLLLVTLLAALVLCALAIVRRYRSSSGDDFSFALGASIGAAAIGGVLLTAPTDPASVVFAALLLGSAVAMPARVAAGAPRHVWPRFLALGGLVVWLVVCGFTLAGATLLDGGLAAAVSGDYERAADLFSQASAVSPWDVDTPIAASEELTKQLDDGDAHAQAAALTWANRAVAADPDSLPAAKSAITAYLDAGQLAAAEKLTARFAALLPNDPWIAERYGAETLADGHPALAESRLIEATRLDPTAPLPWETLAYLYRQEGDPSRSASAAAHAKALGGR